MNNVVNETKSDKYSSRYTRGFLKMLVNDGQASADKYVEQFYSSKNYLERLEAVKYLISVSEKYEIPDAIFMDALQDFCSQVKVYVLQNYNFAKTDSPDLRAALVAIAQSDEKIQARALAIDRLSELHASEHYDLFFATSLLKSSKESAAGLRALYSLDPDKAYQMAKFRTESSSGSLDLAIAEIFQAFGNKDDLGFFKERLAKRTKFNKIDLVRVYLKMLGKIEIEAIVKSHLIYICENIPLTGNTELVQRLIMELYHFVSDNKEFLNKHENLQRFVNKSIDLLLEKDYLKSKRADPFGPI